MRGCLRPRNAPTPLVGGHGLSPVSMRVRGSGSGRGQARDECARALGPTSPRRSLSTSSAALMAGRRTLRVRLLLPEWTLPGDGLPELASALASLGRGEMLLEAGAHARTPRRGSRQRSRSRAETTARRLSSTPASAHSPTRRTPVCVQQQCSSRRRDDARRKQSSTWLSTSTAESAPRHTYGRRRDCSRRSPSLAHVLHRRCVDGADVSLQRLLERVRPH